MDTEDLLKETLEELLIKLGVEFTKIEIEEGENNEFSINIKTDEPSLLIGYHGENIQALQHMLKVLAWAKDESQKYHIMLDVDDYRKRQEENVIKMTERKVDQVRKTGRKQRLSPMSPYFRRKVHLHLMNSGFEDIETYSEGEGDQRKVVIKRKS